MTYPSIFLLGHAEKEKFLKDFCLKYFHSNFERWHIYESIEPEE